MSVEMEKFTETYVDLPLTSFPVEEDTMDRMQDINAVLLPLMNEYNQYMAENNYISANQVLASHPELMSCFFNADKFNKLRDAIIAMQRFQLEQVDKLYERVAQNAIGINDSPSEEQKSLTAYSAQKVEELIQQNKSLIESNQQELTKKVEALKKDYHTRWQVQVPKSGWNSEYPFTNTVSVEGVKADMDIEMIGLFIAESTPVETVKKINKAAGLLMSNTKDDAIGDGTVTFMAYKKPADDFTVILENAPKSAGGA